MAVTKFKTIGNFKTKINYKNDFIYLEKNRNSGDENYRVLNT